MSARAPKSDTGEMELFEIFSVLMGLSVAWAFGFILWTRGTSPWEWVVAIVPLVGSAVGWCWSLAV